MATDSANVSFAARYFKARLGIEVILLWLPAWRGVPEWGLGFIWFVDDEITWLPAVGPANFFDHITRGDVAGVIT